MVAMPVAALIPTAVRAADVAARAITVAMVLDGREGNAERAFRDYFARSGVALRVVPVGRADTAQALRAALRAARPDLIYAAGTIAARAVIEAGSPTDATDAADLHALPMVHCGVPDTTAAGLVVPPGRPVLGADAAVPLPAQWAALMRWRRWSRVGVVADPSQPETSTWLAMLRAQSRSHGVQLLVESWSGASGAPGSGSGMGDRDRHDGIDPATVATAVVARLRARGAELLYLGMAPLPSSDRAVVLGTAAVAAGLPVFSAQEDALRQGAALFGLVQAAADLGRLAAAQALSLLDAAHGQPVPDLPGGRLLVDLDVAARVRSYPPLPLLAMAEVVGSR